ncbi:hypothetical protein [Bacillus benzoevorans]|uniref:Uncharacterized protein n=1 Tax=Bacillus benzoevorans TaxID=1456 RepID=A0A7X0HTC4_9BACI|nr:hypothetical protein [Bacillus benzoevorans]MBB6446482.1 hypothetical protein [Bacillus benzoevorans]
MTEKLTRLEEIKALHSVGKVTVQGMLPSWHISHKDVDWLIERAEKAEKQHFEILALESQANGDKKLIEKLEKEVEFWRDIADSCECNN